MPTLRLQIAYDGAAYHGWQIQPVDRTVEGDLTRAVTRILNADEPVKVQGASRTDAGVHALGQVAHIRHDSKRRLWDFCRGLNALTDADVCVVRIEEADDAFHARHSARGKIYRYRIWNHRFSNPFTRGQAWWVRPRLDVDAMRRAAEFFAGEHDFAGFRSTGCASETTVRRMDSVELISHDSPSMEVVVQGEAFLQHMVRIMVGTLVDVGRGQFGPQRVQQVLEHRDRRQAGMTAPPQGLVLEKVFYPDFPWRGDEPILGGEYLISPRET